MKKIVKIIAIAIVLMVNNLNAQLEYGSYFGKMNMEEFRDGDRDKEGNYYFVGYYNLVNGNNPDLPTTSSSFQQKFGNGYDQNYLISFDKKLKLRWCTYLGRKGTNDGLRTSCKLIKNALYVVFETSDTGFAYNTLKKKKPQKKDLCFIKFSLSGKLIESHYWGGQNDEYFLDWDVDDNYNIILVGSTNSKDSISTNPSYCFNYPGGTNGTSSFLYLIKFDTNFNKKYGTYFSSYMSNGYSPKVCFDSKSNYYVTFVNSGYKVLGTSINKITSSGGPEIEIGRFTANDVLDWSTLLGGEKEESLIQIAVDKSNDNLIVLGVTNSKYFLIDSMKFPKITQLKSYWTDYYIAQFDKYGKRLFSRYLGGNESDKDILLYSQRHSPLTIIGPGKFGVVINTSATNYTMTGSTPFNKSGNGGGDGIFYIINNSGNIEWSTFLGGNSVDEFNGIFKDAASFIFWGSTQSTTGIASIGSNQENIGGNKDGFIQKFTFPLNTDLTIKYPSKQCLDKNIFYVNDNSTAFDTNYVVVDSFSDGTVYQKKSYTHSFKKPGTYYIKHSIYYKNNPNYVSQVTKVVEVYPNPTITKISLVKDTVYQGQKFQLSTTSIDSISYFQWKLDTSYIGAGKTVYYQTDSLGKRKIECTVVSNHGCVSRFYSSIIVLKKLTTSAKELNQKNQQLVFPNPTNNILNIESSFYEIYDLTGKLIISGKSQSQIDVSNLSPGTYFLKTNVDNFKFIKE